MEQNNNHSWGVGGVVLRDNAILLVRHTYGSAKGELLIPGGFVHNDEMPETASEREILEETGIVAKVNGLLGIRFQKKTWYAIYMLDYISGEPVSDGSENDFAGFVPLAEVVTRTDVTYLSKVVAKTVLGKTPLVPLNPHYTTERREDYMLYGLM